MSAVDSKEDLLARIEELESRLAESEQLIEAIKDGEVDAFAVTRNDKQEIYTLQSGDYAYRILIENFNEGALNLSEDGLIVYTNTYFCDLVKLPYEKVISSSVFKLIHASSKKAFKELFSKGLAGQTKGEINLSVGESVIPVYVSLTSLYPKLPTVGMIITDLTEKKNRELLLKKQNAELTRAAQLLEEKNGELAKVNKEMETFNYVSSHDLQEPLRKIELFSHLLLEEEQKNLSDSGKDYLHRMQGTVARMRMLIKDLLAYFQVKNAEIKYEKTDLNKILAEAITDLGETIEEKKAVITTNGLCEMEVIHFQFRQLFYNMISNALKFSDVNRPSQITILCEIETGVKLNNEDLLPEQQYYHLSFADNGIGFAPIYKNRIFEAFQRLHQYHEYKGTGVGLAICKKIVENHGGIITATGELNKGATFDIFIPVVKMGATVPAG